MTQNIRIIRPASKEKENLLDARLVELRSLGFDVIYTDLPEAPLWPYTSASIGQRSQQLNAALTEKNDEIIWAARGGYGCSDLLAQIPWEQLAKAKDEKLIVGFSDISALHAAMYAKLGWHGLHAPMPATTLWRKSTDQTDVDFLIAGLKSQIWNFEKTLDPTSHHNVGGQTLNGPLFGGCFSVLTNLIGTPYFPKSLNDHILFLEDTGENPGRLARFLNQWLQSGVLKGVKALLLGSFRDCCEADQEHQFIYSMFAERTQLPTYVFCDFGHTSPNHPIMIGATASLTPTRFSWSHRTHLNKGVV